MVRLKNPLHSKSASGRVGQIVYGQLGDTAYARTRPNYITPNPSWNNILPKFSWEGFKAGRSKSFVFGYTFARSISSNSENRFFYVDNYINFKATAMFDARNPDFLNEPAFFGAAEMEHYMTFIFPLLKEYPNLANDMARIWQEFDVVFVPIVPTATELEPIRNEDLKADAVEYSHGNGDTGYFFPNYVVNVYTRPRNPNYFYGAHPVTKLISNLNPNLFVDSPANRPIRLFHQTTFSEMVTDNFDFERHHSERIWKLIRGN